MNSDNSLDTKI